MRALAQARAGAPARVPAQAARAPRTIVLGRSNQVIQPRLSIGRVDDPLEREADRVADAVLGGRTVAPWSGAPSVPQRKCAVCAANEEKGIQRKCEDCEKEEGTVRRAAEGATPMPPRGAESAAAAVAGGGAPLGADVRAYFEPRFGRDLSEVRVHAGGPAARAAHAINARAYTLGSDIAFASGEYSPASHEGRRLIAHELAHVVQQSDVSASTVRRWAVRSCNAAREDEINDAVSRAYGDLTRAAALLSQRPATPQIRNALWLAFRDDSDATLDLVTRNVPMLQRNVINAHYACAPDNGGDCGARKLTGYTYLGGGHCPATPSDPGGSVTGDDNIYLCVPAFFDQDDGLQSLTVIHECAHAFLGLCDTGYFASGCEETQPGPSHSVPQDAASGTAGDNPVFRLINADSYACLVHFLAYANATAMSASASDYRGDNLRIASVSTRIYTQTGVPSDPTFRIEGVPYNSGFRFRWHLEAGGIQWRLEEPHGQDTGVLNESVTAVNVSTEVRRLLESNGISSGTIVCEIELFRPSGDRLPPPLLRRIKDITIVRGRDPFDISGLFSGPGTTP